MLSLASSQKVYLALEPVDMRKQYDGLWALVEQHLKIDPFGRALFVFMNKDKNRVKILHWDGSGVWVFAKRLEKGRYSLPAATLDDPKKIDLTPEALTLLLSGIELENTYKKAWYAR